MHTRRKEEELQVRENANTSEVAGTEVLLVIVSVMRGRLAVQVLAIMTVREGREKRKGRGSID